MSRHLDHGRATLMDIFHGYRQAEEHGLAADALERALQTSEYHPEALLWKGIDALPQDPKLAFVFFSNAIQAHADRADIHALIGRSILAQGQPALASRYLARAWERRPNDPALRMMLWQARSQSESADKLRRLILAQLPDITAPTELGFVLKLLAAQQDTPGTVGVVRYVPEVQEIHGWAIDLRNLQTPVALNLEANGRALKMTASASHPLLTAAGLPVKHGGVRIKIPNATPAVHVRFETGQALQGSPVYAMPGFVPPQPVISSGEKQPIDVLIPVFNGLDETLECINSALLARKLNRTNHRIVVIEDDTPLPALRKALKVLASKGKITLLQNPVNLGFIRSMNRGMALSLKQDVVWLNADTRVHGNWLDRLRTVAYSAEDIASVTPFTNNGELMSFPVSRVSQPMPTAAYQAQIDDLARLSDCEPMEIETGCGFCLYIKRAALDSVGYLDDIHLSRGYGEETDWCLRARAKGWRHMGAPDVFVAHQGGISFGDEKALRVAHNNAILRERYPEASARFENFCLRDPIKPARQGLQRARLKELAQQMEASSSSTWPPQGFRLLRVKTSASPDAPLTLTWSNQGQHSTVSLTAQLQPLAFSLDYKLPADSQRLLDDLQSLPLDELIYEQLAGCPAELFQLPAGLGKPYRIICRDDTLLDPDRATHWRTFATQALSIQIPWQALHDRYAEALPNANITIEHCAGSLPTAPAASSVLLIADNLGDEMLARRWVELGRRITRDKLPVLLLSHGTSPWFKTLQATGAVHALPELAGLELDERVALAGCNAALSLVTNPGADWHAPTLAAKLGLALYAMPSEVATEAGALPFNLLAISSSQA